MILLIFCVLVTTDVTIKDLSRSTIGYIEDGRIRDKSRDTLGYFDGDVVRDESRKTIGRFRDCRWDGDDRLYFDGCSKDDREAMVAYIFFFVDD